MEPESALTLFAPWTRSSTMKPARARESRRGGTGMICYEVTSLR